VGYVNERTMPAREIATALGDVLRRPDRHRQPLNYGGPTGSENLLASVRRYLLDNRVGQLTESDLAGRRLIVGPNGATSLLESFARLLRPGLVITSDPMYYIYTDFLQRTGFDLLPCRRRDGLRVDRLTRVDALRAKVTPDKLFYVVTVNNPPRLLSNRRRAPS
jgi:DNA-binding transcriptional MocR family regulator